MTTEIVEVAQSVASFLAPFLPFLVRASKQAADEATRDLGDEAWKQAKAVWTRLHPSMETHPAVRQAIETAATQPTVDQPALANHLTALLMAEPNLVPALQALVPPEQTYTETTTVIQHGNQFLGPVYNPGQIIGRDSNVRGKGD